MKIRNGLVAMLLIWMLFGSMISIIPGRVQASPVTVVNIRLQPEPPKVEVSPGNSGIVTLTGTVYCLKYGPDQVKVTLIGSSDTCGADVIPPNMVFGGTGGSEETRSFAVTTRVPMGTLFGEIPSITVSGSFIQGDIQYPIESVNQIIEVDPYYKLEVDPPPPQEIGPGEFVYFSIKITNVGNTEDTYEFQFDNLHNLNNKDKEWTVDTVTPKRFLPKETKTIVVSAQNHKKRSEDKIEIHKFNFRITSQQSQDEGDDVKYFVPIYIQVRAPFTPRIIPHIMLIGCIIITMVFAWRGWDQNEKVRRGDI